MNYWTKIKEKIKSNEDLSEIASSSFKDILNGGILSNRAIKKHYPLLLLVAFLTVFYVGNRLHSERQIAQISKLKDDLERIKYKSLVISVELTQLGRRSYVLDYIDEKALGLKESRTPPVYIQPPSRERDKKAQAEREAHKKATQKMNQQVSITE